MLGQMLASVPNPESVLENIKLIVIGGFLGGLVVYFIGYFVFLRMQKKSREIGEREAVVGEKLEHFPGRSAETATNFGSQSSELKGQGPESDSDD